MNLGRYQEDPIANNALYSCILPIITILCFMYYPDSNETAIVVGMVSMVILLIVTFAMMIKKGQYYNGLRLVLLSFFLDITNIFWCLTIVRATQSIVPAVILLPLLAITIFLAHKYPEIILTEANTPKTKLGKIVIAFVFLSSGGGAFAGYQLTNGFGLNVVGPVLYMAMLYVIALVHANFHIILFKRDENAAASQ